MTIFSRYLSLILVLIVATGLLGCRAVNLQGDVPLNTAANAQAAPAEQQVQQQPIIEPTQIPAQQETQQQVEQQPAQEAQPAEQTQVQVEPTAVPAQQPALNTDRGSHVVAFGETLGIIAEAYGVPVELLAQVNGIANVHYIDANQQLVIPSADEVAQWNGGVAAEYQPDPAQPAIDPAASAAGTAYDPNNYFEHTVQWGESLGYLSLVYDYSIADIAAYNGISDVDELDIGQVVRIPNQ